MRDRIPTERQYRVTPLDRLFLPPKPVRGDAQRALALALEKYGHPKGGASWREIVALIAVFGTPQPAGSKRAFVRNGHASVTDANPRSREWKTQVAQAAGDQYDGELLDGPLSVEMKFVQPRPKGHYGTGRNAEALKPSAPEWPASRPDVLKLARGAEDALTGVIWRDDAQIVDEHLTKTYGAPARCEIAVYRMGIAAAREAARAEEAVA